MLDLRWLLSLLLLLSLPLAGCPTGDDDDSAAGDDDDATGDDDDSTGDDDDSTGDDDDSTGDDDDSTDPPMDYDAATVPDFADCDASQNQFKAMLGDGTVIGPFSGFSPAPASFANNNGQWQLRMGAGASFNQLVGNREGYVANTPIAMQGPAATPGNVLTNILVDAGDLGGGAAPTAGGYGLPTINADARVQGTVTFTTLPEPGATAAGTFEAVLQNQQQLNMGNTVLLGISGCFSAPLTATD